GTTRIRYALDGATGGALGRERTARARSFREWARRGFAGHWPLLAVTELVLGRPSDRRTDSWTAMFLPSELRDEVARCYRAPPEIVYQRRAPVESGAAWLGHLAFALGGLGLALAIVAGARLGRASWRAALALASLVLGIVALILDA